MIQRTLFPIAFSEEWGRQMRFVTGPRQSGKTTLAKLKLEQEGDSELYYLWDLRSVRNRYRTLKSYLKRLEDFYLAFKVHPYSKNIKRALLKAPKCYLYDWTRAKDPGKRFENYVAVELMTQIHLWMDSSEDRFALFYIRTKEKEETDFLIVKNEAPWLLLEIKLSDGPIAKPHYKVQAALKGIPLVQLCREEGVLADGEQGELPNFRFAFSFLSFDPRFKPR